MNALIVGCSKGIGRELTKQFLEHGHHVWGICRDTSDLLALKNDYANRFQYFHCDTRLESDIDNVIAWLTENNSWPDLCVISAGIYQFDISETLNTHLFRSAIDTNLLGPMYWVDRLLPFYEKMNKGQFIVVSSALAFKPDRLSASYPASKAGISLAFRSLQCRYAHTSIMFKVIYFGPVSTLVLPQYANRKTPPWVLSVAHAARIIRTVAGRSGVEFYYPRLIIFFIAVTSLLPDKLYCKIIDRLRR